MNIRVALTHPNGTTLICEIPVENIPGAKGPIDGACRFADWARANGAAKVRRQEHRVHVHLPKEIP